MVCEACQMIFKESFPDDENDHQITAQQLERAAMEGCYICRVCYSRDLKDPSCAQVAAGPSPISTYKFWPPMVVTEASAFLKPLELQFTIFHGATHRSGKVVTFCLQASSEAGRLFDQGEFADANSWESSTSVVRMWLRQCLEKHDRCRVISSDDILGAGHPTRLLQIGQHEDDNIRLLLCPDEVGTQVQYATVSHCWGQSPFLQLTSDSMPRLQQGISISALGETFQDVIYIARSLRIRLLWVDALCIFQDSREDWEREAPPAMLRTQRRGQEHVFVAILF